MWASSACLVSISVFRHGFNIVNTKKGESGVWREKQRGQARQTDKKVFLVFRGIGERKILLFIV